MKRWLFRIIGIGVLGFIAFEAFNFYRAGLWSLPELPKGAYFLSYSNGLRAIVLDAEVTDTNRDDSPRYSRSLSRANRDRKYLSVPLEVQPWFEDAWSWCKAPTDAERAEVERMPEEFRRSVENARFEAVCRIDVDGNDVLRGLIFSVPRL